MWHKPSVTMEFSGADEIDEVSPFLAIYQHHLVA
jgi:hypothetical protein